MIHAPVEVAKNIKNVIWVKKVNWHWIILERYLMR